VGYIPRVATLPTFNDTIGTVLTRIGPTRNNYKVTPGLYATGTPNTESPVLVTANYKLSLDCLRFQLDNIDSWLLVADTRGVNVWCAAGKGTFSTDEIILSVKECNLNKLVSHRQLILPQLGATGVAGYKVKKECGFVSLFGPVHTRDIPAYLQNNNKASDKMRSITFTLKERAELIPVELYYLLQPLIIIFLGGYLLSGVSPTFFSTHTAWTRNLDLFGATLIGIGCGAVIVPLILPWLPGRQFWFKGLYPGIIIGLLYWNFISAHINGLEGAALLLWVTAISSYLSMNFTGCTPFTSPTGVEHEMRRGIPVQTAITVISLFLWITGAFTG
jgi:hypothetical protein